jgi:hypothetical protein
MCCIFLQPQARDRPTGVAVDRPQESAHSRRVCDRGEMLDGGGFKETAKVPCDVALAEAQSDPVTEYLTTTLLGSTGGLQQAARLNFFLKRAVTQKGELN